MKLLYGADVDRRLSWPVGRAERMARRGKLPHVLLPDGAIRFRWSQIVPLIESKFAASKPRAVSNAK